MTHKVKVQFGGAVDSTVHDYSADVRLFNKDGSPAIHGGMRFDSGGGSVGEFILIDDDNRIPAGDAPPNDLHLAGHNPVWWIEDSPGYESWLSVGWIDVKDVGRFGHPYSVSRTWQASWADANKELDGITLLTAEARPAESGVDRLQWVIDTFYSGDPRPSTDLSTDSDFIPATGAVPMPAKTYEAGTAAQDIIKECAGTEGKVYGVIIHDAASASHKCFQYIDEEDHTTNLSPAKISDQIADWNPRDPTNPVFEPHWLQGAAATEDPGELISGVVSTWKGGTVTVTDATHADDYNYYVIPINDDTSENVTQATAYATAYLRSRWNEHVTHQPSIMVAPAQHPLIRAGMSIQIKAAASMGGQYLGTYQTRRIAEVNWEPGGMWNGEPFLWAHLQLDRPLRILAAPGPGKPGPQPPTAGTPGSSVTYEKYTFDGDGNNPVAGGEEPVLHPAPINLGSTSWYGSPSNGVQSPGLNGTSYKHSVNHDDGMGLAIPAGTNFTWSFWWEPFNDPVYFYLTYFNDAGTVIAGPTLKVTATGSAASYSFTDTVPTGATCMQLKGWTGSGPSGVQGTFWVDQGLITVNDPGVPGDSPPPASDDDTGSIGEAGCTTYACSTHKHPAQTAAVTPITDAGGYYTSDNVEGALAELGADVAATIAPVPLTPFDQHDLPRGYNLTRQGLIISPAAGWKSSLVESPNVSWHPGAGKYVMVATGYDGTHERLGVWTADTPDGPWTEYGSNPFFSESGAGADAGGVTGGFVWHEDGTSHLFYIGLTSTGYESGTKAICHATSTDWIPGTNAGTWTRHGAVISPGGGGWRDTAVWHTNIVKRGATYYLFFNATGTGTDEAIGYATSTDLSTWTVDDTNSPLLSAGSGWESVKLGDPFMYRIGETWYMAYEGYDGTNAGDGLAFTSDADFPLGWTKYANNPVLPHGSSGYDSLWAGRPCIWITPTKYYHWYSANDGSTRGIGLATESISGASVRSLDDLSDVAITTPAVGDMLRYDGSTWVNSALRWEPVTTDPGTGPEIVFTSTDIVMTWADYS